jgi:[CysO sulfur-carrier protein]-S-L-cysteine hydrolase
MPGVRTMTNAVQLPRSVVDRLLRLARQTPDEEICGLISRDRNGFKSCYPVANTAADRKRFFALDPRGQIEAMRAMRERGEELAAIYHSHPESPPFPSQTDIDQHEYPGVLYLIISPGNHGLPELRGFDIRDRAVREITVVLEEASAA